MHNQFTSDLNNNVLYDLNLNNFRIADNFNKDADKNQTSISLK